MKLNEILGIDFPLIVAPMFLVTNTEMMIAACTHKVSGCIPALNYRTIDELKKGLREIKDKATKPIGVNLIVNKSNVKFPEQLKVCVDEGVDYFITSLGNPKPVIEAAKKSGAKVFCDVVDVEYAKKVEDLGADALIAVNKGAGGHAGNIPSTILLPLLKRNTKLPVISAGGVATGDAIFAMEVLGADGVSVGTPFIACTESGVTEGYKQAIVDYKAKDIVMTDKLSGTMCTVINTDYVKKVGTEQNPVEKFLNSNRKVKKYAKMLTYYKGMKLLEKAAFSGTYKTMWCAGPSLEFTEEIRPLHQIVDQMIKEYEETKSKFKS